MPKHVDDVNDSALIVRKKNPDGKITLRKA